MEATIFESLSSIDLEDLDLIQDFLDSLIENSFLDDPDTGPVTFFAPTDQAFISFFNSVGLLEGSDEDEARDALEELSFLGVRFLGLDQESDSQIVETRFADQFLNYHSIDGAVELNDLLDGQELQTRQGGVITVAPENLIDLASELPNPIRPTEDPSEASNGLVYVIDELLWSGDVVAISEELAGERVEIGEGLALVVGSALGDDITLSSGEDFLVASDGDDTVQGGKSADGISGGAGDDELRGGKGADDLAGGAGSDLLKGGRGDDFIFDAGFTGDNDDNDADTLEGGNGDDTLYAFTGEMLHGGRGADLLIKLFLDNAELAGGKGQDVLASFGTQSSLIGGRGADALLSLLNDDTLKGGRGADTFIIDVSGGDGFKGVEDLQDDAVILDFDESVDSLQFFFNSASDEELDSAAALNDPDSLELSDLIDADLLSVTLSNQDGDLLVTFSEDSALLVQGLDGDLSFEEFEALVDVVRDTEITDLVFGFLAG